MEKDNVPPYSVHVLGGQHTISQIYIYIYSIYYIYIHTHTYIHELVISTLKKVKHNEETGLRGTLLHTQRSQEDFSEEVTFGQGLNEEHSRQKE